MKKAAIFGLVLVLIAGIGLISCEGPAGPTGPRGPEGPEGPQGPSGTTDTPGFPLSSSYEGKPRLVITTDPELDDQASLAHMFLYLNEINIAALIISDSQYHFRGFDPSPLGLHVDEPPVTQQTIDMTLGRRWPTKLEGLTSFNGNHYEMYPSHIDLAFKAYRDAYPYLVQHDSNYPPPYKLESLYWAGNVTGDPRIRHELRNPGATHVATILLDDIPGQVFLQGWGGMTTIAQALHDIRRAFGPDSATYNAAKWAEIQNKIYAKAVVTGFGYQEIGGTTRVVAITEIGKYWPGIQIRQLNQQSWGYAWINDNTAVFEEDRWMGLPPWTLNNTFNAGPLGSLYWHVGSHPYGSEFDTTTWAAPAGAETDQETLLRAIGAWPSRNSPYGRIISEGDSSNWALHVNNGLRNWDHPSYGGWGGRQVPRQNYDVDITATQYNPWTHGIGPGGTPWPNGVPDVWTNASVDLWTTFANDFVRDTVTSRDRNESAQARWFPYWMAHFAARLQWSQKGPAEVNHQPIITVTNSVTSNQTLEFDFFPSPSANTVTLTANISDPDGDEVNVRWWHYAEAGRKPYTNGGANPALIAATPAGEPAGTLDRGNSITITIPANAQSGDEIHIIAEAVDVPQKGIKDNDGNFIGLAAWQRIVITVR